MSEIASEYMTGFILAVITVMAYELIIYTYKRKRKSHNMGYHINPTPEERLQKKLELEELARIESVTKMYANIVNNYIVHNPYFTYEGTISRVVVKHNKVDGLLLKGDNNYKITLSGVYPSSDDNESNGEAVYTPTNKYLFVLTTIAGGIVYYIRGKIDIKNGTMILYINSIYVLTNSSKIRNISTIDLTDPSSMPMILNTSSAYERYLSHEIPVNSELDYYDGIGKSTKTTMATIEDSVHNETSV